SRTCARDRAARADPIRRSLRRSPGTGGRGPEPRPRHARGAGARAARVRGARGLRVARGGDPRAGRESRSLVRERRRAAPPDASGPPSMDSAPPRAARRGRGHPDLAAGARAERSAVPPGPGRVLEATPRGRRVPGPRAVRPPEPPRERRRLLPAEWVLPGLHRLAAILGRLYTRPLRRAARNASRWPRREPGQDR